MNYQNLLRIYFLILIIGIIPNLIIAQTQKTETISLEYINSHLEEWSLQPEDVQDLHIHQFTDDYNGVTHIYYNQQYNGYKINNAVTSIHISKDGEAYCLGNKFYGNIKQRINETKPKITATEALTSSCTFLNIPVSRNIETRKISDSEYLVKQPEFAYSDIKIELYYQPTKDGQLRLVWDLAIDQKDNSDYMSIRVDAVTGKVIDHNSWTTHCNLHKNTYKHQSSHQSSCQHDQIQSRKETQNVQNAPAGDATYRVVKFPNASPSHKLPELLVNQEDSIASPFGWHDTDGVEGAEYTITRGNNVYAYLDSLDTGNPDFSPDGGESLIFDYPFDIKKEPQSQVPAAVTNLFYCNNYMHDFSYIFGFTEKAGNFQASNYGRAPGYPENDAVIAEAQDGSRKAIDPPLNNANFVTGPDGSTSRMQMYLFRTTQAKIFEVLEPASVAGNYQSQSADYGPHVLIDDLDITGQVAIVQDERPSYTDGCQEPTNAAELNGKIVLVDRGRCFFEDKTLFAEEAGAIAVIICNFEDVAMGMTGGVTNKEPTIPTVSLGKSDCQKLRVFAGSDLKIRIHLQEPVTPLLYDASFDNTIIAHEYAHGISNRLSGGAGNGSALSNKEQMGEGWSDYFALVTTVSEGDKGSDARGMATYVEGQTTSGPGNRNFPYSTDMSINPLTYGSVAADVEEHAVGEVWAVMLWDLYWALIDKHGYDANPKNKEAGNNICTQLVMDGMKFQRIHPGFVDARDGILLADKMTFNEENTCLIWEVFARRGLGVDADQGDSDVATDQIESFEHLATCIEELKIVKTVQELVNPGEDIDYALNITNHTKSLATNVVVTDEIPEGCTYIDGSGNNNPTVDNGIISWELGNMESGTEIDLSYKVKSSDDIKSKTLFYDGLEGNINDVEERWSSYSAGDTDDFNKWELIEDETIAYSGINSYYVSNTGKSHDEMLITLDEIQISGENPYFRFYHKYNTETAADVGLIYISTDEGETWQDLGPFIVKNPYSGPVQYATFTIPFLRGYSGDSEGFVETYVDLSTFVGENIIFRWRFGSDDNTAGTGWIIDEIAVMDLASYKGEACVTSDESEKVCTEGGSFGTAVQPNNLVSINDIEKTQLNINVYPNPASNNLTISMPGENSKSIDISLIAVDGKIVKTYSNKYQQRIDMNIENVPSGFYFLQVQTDNGIGIQKVIIE